MWQYINIAGLLPYTPEILLSLPHYQNLPYTFAAALACDRIFFESYGLHTITNAVESTNQMTYDEAVSQSHEVTQESSNIVLELQSEQTCQSSRITHVPDNA